MQANAKLSPPWYTLANELHAILTPDPEVKVSPLEEISSGSYEVRVSTGNPTKARALAYVLNPSFQMGNIAVAVGVYDLQGQRVDAGLIIESLEVVPQMFNNAFQGNPLYKGVETRPFMPGGTAKVFPIFAAKVVQFFNDDISDFYGNANLVAAEAFREILRPLPQLGPYPSTEKIG